MRNSVVFVGVLLLCAGCGTLVPDTPLEHPDVMAHLCGLQCPLPHRVGVWVDPCPRPESEPVHGSAFAVDTVDLRAGVVYWLREANLFQEVVDLTPRMTGPLPPEEKAKALGLTLLIRIAPGGGKVTYIGRNGLWWPSLIVWLLAWFPSWLIPDETFGMEVWGAVEVVDLAAGASLGSYAALGSVQKGLNDLQRGFHLLGIFRAPACLNRLNYRSVRRRLADPTWCDFHISFLLGLFRILERAVPGVKRAAGKE
ncbi:MAG: hypothetical protein ACYS47_01855 [Planctomycetota bacterium]